MSDFPPPDEVVFLGFLSVFIAGVVTVGEEISATDGVPVKSLVCDDSGL